jgi:hypothetical protein
MKEFKPTETIPLTIVLFTIESSLSPSLWVHPLTCFPSIRPLIPSAMVRGTKSLGKIDDVGAGATEEEFKNLNSKFKLLGE